MKNRIKNLSYFVKRLKDNGFIVWKIMDQYNVGDPRKWTILINPGIESAYITCFVNDEYLDYQSSFSFDDGGIRFKNNLKIKTLSMEVIITHLIKNGIDPDPALYHHLDKINNYNNNGSGRKE